MAYNILVQDFCPLKIKITQFPGGFRLKTVWTYLTSQETVLKFRNVIGPFLCVCVFLFSENVVIG